jgi:hypothetical protein
MELTLRLSQPEWMDRAEGASLEKKVGLSFYVLQRHLPTKISNTWATVRDSHCFTLIHSIVFKNQPLGNSGSSEF